ncbi:1,4-dihydroxy-2-naphthoate octaprenyltransferase [Alloscardovia macacae]|uniref:1,4-dihydroxy-2-naphthoate octaprenyltransferase n=1 Tax=Alloscardovia macacae TaxID=1160091 RepID=UPI000A2E7367|nr:1,4-dihydroxy-2-naphthoate octaprenyltransferase [Alloscardovia macacae]OTA26563.1 1,4-dihydroxy-2-naphthoate octaprenyltransferase [Alloscardovia macacae]
MRTLRLLILGSRPRTWALSVCPVLVALLCASMDSFLLGTTFWSGSVRVPLEALLCVVVALSLQISANFSNDYIDGIRGVDRLRGDGAPVRMNAAGGASLALRGAIGSCVLGIVAGVVAVCLSRQYWLLGVGALCVLAAWGYSSWASARGLGELLAFLFFGPVVVLCVEALILSGGGGSARVGPWALLGSVQCGVLAASVLLVNNLRDEYSDRAAGKRTLVVRWGGAFGRWLLAAWLGCVLVLSWGQFFVALFTLSFRVNVWLSLAEVLVLSALNAVTVWGLLHVWRAVKRPAFYARVFSSVNLLMILLTLHAAAVWLVVNAL